VYFLDILEHDFYNEDLFKIIKNNWNHIIEPYKMSYEPSNSNRMSKNDRKDLLKSGLNLMNQIDNNTYALCELAMSGHNIDDVMTVDRIFEKLHAFEAWLAKNNNIVLHEIQKISNGKLNILNVEIVITNGRLCFVETISGIVILLDDINDKVMFSKECCSKNNYSMSFNS
jgi:hypothetical protein